MFSIKSALFIDRENIALPAEAIANWLAWLEDGHFDGGKRRRFLIKRIYWNSSAERHHEQFKKHGFEIVVCERFAGLGNSADIRMAIDIVEMVRDRPAIKEYILVTSDSDFVPVIQKLDERGKRTAVVVDESQPNVHTTYRQHADVLILKHKLRGEAVAYTRPRRRGFGIGRLLRLRSIPSSRPTPASKKSEPTASASAPMAVALDRLIKVTSLKPREYTSQKIIITSWKEIPGFSTSGKSAFFGKGSYRALVSSLAERDKRIRVTTQKGGGTGVMYVAND